MWRIREGHREEGRRPAQTSSLVPLSVSGIHQVVTTIGARTRVSRVGDRASYVPPDTRARVEAAVEEPRYSCPGSLSIRVRHRVVSPVPPSRDGVDWRTGVEAQLPR